MEGNLAREKGIRRKEAAWSEELIRRRGDLALGHMKRVWKDLKRKERKGGREKVEREDERMILTGKASEDFAAWKRCVHEQADNSFRDGFA